MADRINVKVNQNISGNKFYGKSTVKQRARMRFTFPANVIVNVKTRRNPQRNQRVIDKKPETQQKEPKSSD